RAAIFVHHNGEVQSSFEKQLEELFETRRFGDVNQLPGYGLQLGARADLEPHRIQILDVNDPERFVQIAAIAQGEARIAGLLGDLDAFGDAGFGIQRDDFLPRPHDLASNPTPQIERVKDDVAAQNGAAG